MYIIFEGLESCLDNMKISEKRFCTTFQFRRHDSIVKVYSWFIARENENYMWTLSVQNILFHM